MTDKEKLEKIKSLADKMYTSMQYLTSDTRPIRKAMEEYHSFIVHEYHKEEPVKLMTLQEFLRFVSDEEQKCTLEIDNGDDEYTYMSFWLSDFRNNMARANKCKNYIVTGFNIGYKSELVIEVKKGVLFDSKEDAEVAQQNLIIMQEPRIMEAAVPPRIYISGPISGYDLAERRRAFKKVQKALEMENYYVFNPLHNGLPAEATTQQHMQRDLAELTREDKPYDAIFMMEGWNHSAGCMTEFHVATAIGLHVYFEQAEEMIRFI